jgi:hypothetical protein
MNGNALVGKGNRERTSEWVMSTRGREIAHGWGCWIRSLKEDGHPELAAVNKVGAFNRNKPGRFARALLILKEG